MHARRSVVVRSFPWPQCTAGAIHHLRASPSRNSRSVGPCGSPSLHRHPETNICASGCDRALGPALRALAAPLARGRPSLGVPPRALRSLPRNRRGGPGPSLGLPLRARLIPMASITAGAIHHLRASPSRNSRSVGPCGPSLGVPPRALRSFPLDRRGWLARDIVDDAIDATDLIGDPRAIRASNSSGSAPSARS